MYVVLLLVAFWAFQVIANFFFKYGDVHKELWWHCLIIGNVFGASSIWFVMKLFHYMNPNLLSALGAGVTFVLVQLLYVLVFHSRPSTLQWAGITLVFLGVTLASISAPQNAPQVAHPAVQHQAVSPTLAQAPTE